MDELRFAKYNGTGNDFVLISDVEDRVRLDERLVAAICDRHRGVGAVGLIRVTGAQDSDFFMNYYNADESVAMMSRNSSRSIAKSSYETALLDERDPAFTIR